MANTHRNDLVQELSRVMEARNKVKQNKAFTDWCAALDALPSDYKPSLKDNFKADLELQPHRWLSAGVDLLQSTKVTTCVQLMNGQLGPPLQSVLFYPVFHIGAETFLKGMWLCQYDDCRMLAQNGYINATTRKNYTNHLKDLGHDLLKIIVELRKISQYQNDSHSMQFLKRVESVIRQHYFPLYEADKKSREWAHSRYPKRFYKDATQEGQADAWQSYPQQSLIVQLFEPMDKHVDKLWGLRSGLLAARKNKTP